MDFLARDERTKSEELPCAPCFLCRPANPTTRDGQALQNAARVSLDHAFVASLLSKLRKVSDAPNKDSCGHSSPKNPTNYG